MKITKILIFVLFLSTIKLFAAEGYPGYTIHLDGGECVEMPYSADLNPAQFTISFWAMVEDGAGTFRSPVTSRSSTTGYMFYAGDDDNWQFWCRNGTATSMKIVGPAVEMNKWTHIAGTYDGSKMIFYVDGTFAGVYWASSFAPNTQYPLRIGGGNTEGTPTYFFYGNIDEVSVWNYAKTVDEVRKGMYNTFTGSETGLVSYWQFNGDLIDAIGSNNGNSYQLEFPNDMILSDIIIGAGASDHFIYDQTATYEFINTDVVIYSEQTGTDSVLVSRINRNPNVIPDGYDGTYSYWVFRDFGEEAYDATVLFAPEYDIPDSYSGKNSYFKLFTRGIDSTGLWSYVGEPAVLNTTDNTMIFYGLDLNKQYMISYNRLPQISTSQSPLIFTNSGTLLSVSSRAVTTAADIDNDGNLDLIVGKDDGTLSHYEADMFNPQNFFLVTDDFCNINVGTYSTPTFVDLDSNGKLNLIIGNGDGNLLVFSQITSAPEVFTYSTMLENSTFETIDVGAYSAPSFTDLDGDGLLDMLVGNSAGNINHYEQNPPNSTLFNLVTSSFNSIDVGTYSVPSFTDLDGNGLLDMLVGKSVGYINHYEQDSPNSTVFNLVTSSFNGIIIGSYTAPSFTDLDGDGLLDMLVGESDGNLNHYEQVEISDIAFGNAILGNSSIKSYYMKAQNLISDLNLSVTSEFKISLSEDTGYSNNLSITPSDGIFSDSIFVKFSPLEEIEYSGQISHVSNSCETKYINLTGKGASVSTVPGTSLDFDGINDYVTITDDNILDLTNNFTIEAWIKPSGFATMAGIVSKYHTSGANGYYIRLNSVSPYTGLSVDGLSTANGILEADKLYHIATVNDNGSRHLYVNGREIPLTGTPGTINSNSDPLRIGVDYLTNSRYFNGKIDEVRLWNTARSLQDIREKMNSPLDGTETGLVSYWQLNEGSGAVANDIIRNNNGILTNMDDTDWVNSTIPFGSGSVNTQIVSATGIVDFTDTGISMDFTEKSGTDTLVVTRIDLAPNIEPSDVDSSFNSQYWIVHKFGSGALNADMRLTVSEDLTGEDEANPSRIKLYSRNSTSDSSWTYKVSTALIDSLTNTATFEGITEFSQLIICKDMNIPDNVMIIIDGTNIVISWDTVSGTASYKIYASDDPYGIFVDVSSAGTFNGTSWTIEYTESKKFYYVVAVSGSKNSLSTIKNREKR